MQFIHLLSLSNFINAPYYKWYIVGLSTNDSVSLGYSQVYSDTVQKPSQADFCFVGASKGKSVASTQHKIFAGEYWNVQWSG